MLLLRPLQMNESHVFLRWKFFLDTNHDTLQYKAIAIDRPYLKECLLAFMYHQGMEEHHNICSVLFAPIATAPSICNVEKKT
jgi:hypothetical protein